MPLQTNYPRFSPSSHFNSILLHTLNTSANIPPINSSSYSYTLLIYTSSPLNHFHSFSIPLLYSFRTLRTRTHFISHFRFSIRQSFLLLLFIQTNNPHTHSNSLHYSLSSSLQIRVATFTAAVNCRSRSRIRHPPCRIGNAAGVIPKIVPILSFPTLVALFQET